MNGRRLKLASTRTEQKIWLGSARRLEHCPTDEQSIAMLKLSTRINPTSHISYDVTRAMTIDQYAGCSQFLPRNIVTVLSPAK